MNIFVWILAFFVPVEMVMYFMHFMHFMKKDD